MIRVHIDTTASVFVLTLAAILILEGCPFDRSAKSPLDSEDAAAPLRPAADADDAPPEAASPSVTAACVRACKKLAALGCPEALMPDGGKPCAQLCADSEAAGLSLKPSCVAGAKDSAGVRACGTVRCAAK